MSQLESILFWITLGIYSLGCGGYVYAFVFKNERIFGKLMALVWLGFALHTAVIVARFDAVGHLPWAGDYEQALMGGWFIMLVTLIVARRNPELHFLTVGTAPATLLIMGFGVMRNPTLDPMTASLKTFWLYIHVYFAWLAYGAYMMAMAAGILFLLKSRNAARALPNPIYEKMPRLERLEELIFKYVVYGFITNGIEIVAGSIWAKDLWGSYWSWDPVETWALVGWLQYGIFIHLRGTMGWKGAKLAWLSILAVVAIFVSFFGVNIAVETSMHVFNLR